MQSASPCTTSRDRHAPAFRGYDLGIRPAREITRQDFIAVSATVIVATLPVRVVPAGTYTIDFTVGAVGPDGPVGPPRPPGAKGDTGDIGPQGLKDDISRFAYRAAPTCPHRVVFLQGDQR